jgi:hypothetical protein
MGILDNNQIIENPIPPNIRVANRLRNLTRQTFQTMVENFNSGSAMFWKNPSGVPAQDIADALGPDAAEIFNLHQQLGALLNNIKPESISEGTSIVGQFVTNPDGTVTIIDPDQNNN